MRKLHLLTVLLVAVFLAHNVAALRIEQRKNTIVLEGRRLLPRSVQLTKTSFCFFGAAAEDSSEPDDASAFCSFDGGARVEKAQTTHTICTSGVVVDQHVYCAHEELPHDEDGELEYSALMFTGQDNELREEETEKRFTFRSGKQTGEIKQVLFDGNALHLGDDEDAHVLVSTVINDAEERKVAIFKSDDGFVFKPVAVVAGAEKAEAHHLLFEGGKRLVLVSAYEGGSYSSASSGYAGSFWSAAKPLSSAAPPTSASFASGVLVQYASSNETSRGAKWYVMEEGAKRALTPKGPSVVDRKETSSTPVLFFSVVGVDGSKELVVVQDESRAKKPSGVRISAFKVDDSEEAKEKADKIAKEKEEEMKREAARFAAKLERLEREKAQRREQRRKELERKQKFLSEDEPNVRSAKSFMEVDGEMILVRRVLKESVALEKEVFFSDL